MVLCYRPFCTWLLRISDFYAAITAVGPFLLHWRKLFVATSDEVGRRVEYFILLLTPRAVRKSELADSLPRFYFCGCLYVIESAGVPDLQNL